MFKIIEERDLYQHTQLKVYEISILNSSGYSYTKTYLIKSDLSRVEDFIKVLKQVSKEDSYNKFDRRYDIQSIKYLGEKNCTITYE